MLYRNGAFPFQLPKRCCREKQGAAPSGGPSGNRPTRAAAEMRAHSLRANIKSSSPDIQRAKRSAEASCRPIRMPCRNWRRPAARSRVGSVRRGVSLRLPGSSESTVPAMRLPGRHGSQPPFRGPRTNWGTRCYLDRTHRSSSGFFFVWGLAGPSSRAVRLCAGQCGRGSRLRESQ